MEASSPRSIKEFGETIKEVVQTIKTHNNDGRLVEAKELIDSIQQSLEVYRNLENLCDSEKFFLSQVTNFWEEQSNLVEDILTNYSEVMNLLSDWDSDEVWEQSYSGTDYSVAFKFLPNTSFYKIKLEGTMKCSVIQLLAVINEINMYGSWVPYMMGVGLQSSSEIFRPSRYGVVGHLDIAIPWPLSNRDFAFQALGVDLLNQRGKVFILLKNANPGVFKDIPKRDYPRAELIAGGILVDVHTHNEGEIHTSFVFSLDPKMAVIPAWLINWAMKTFSGYLFSAIVETACSIGVDPESAYMKQIASRPEFYNVLDERYRKWRKIESNRSESSVPNQF